MVIELTNVRFGYSGKPKQTVLNIPYWSMMEGERSLIHGHSGSGKSTLLGLLSGLLTPVEGEVTVLGQRLDQMNSRKRDRFRAEHIGYVFQQFNLIPYLNAVDNIRVARQFSRRKASGKQCDEIKELLSTLNIPDHEWYRPARHLSIGQQQRVAIARALINKPKLVIADEPTSSLDSANRDAFMALLMSRVSDTNMALVFVSHDLTLSTYFNRIDHLNEINQQESKRSGA